MKTKITFLFFLFAASIAGYSQQIPNGSFDVWTSPLAPDGWVSIENLAGLPFNNFTFQDSLDKVDGYSSLKLISDTIPGNPQYGIVSGQVSTGTGTLGANGPVLAGIPFTSRPDTLIFDYKRTSPAGADSSTLDLALTLNGGQVFDNRLTLPDESNWTHIEYVMTSHYSLSSNPDSLLMQIAAGSLPNGAGVLGTVFHIDHVRFGYNLTTGLPAVVKPVNDMTVYPSPANNNVTIELNEGLNEKGTLQIFSLNGQLVKEVNISALQNKTSVSVTDLQPGSYLLKLVSGQNVFNKNIVVVR